MPPRRRLTLFIPRILLSASLVTLLLASAGSSLAQTMTNSRLPDFFGVYFESGGSVVEVPKANPRLEGIMQQAETLMQKNPANEEETQKARDELLRWAREFVGSCYQVKRQPTFIVYSDQISPEVFKLTPFQIIGDRSPVPLGVAPVESRKSMYRLVPREELKANVYLFNAAGPFGGSSGWASCFALDITGDQWFDSNWNTVMEVTRKRLGTAGHPASTPATPAPLAATVQSPIAGKPRWHGVIVDIKLSSQILVVRKGDVTRIVHYNHSTQFTNGLGSIVVGQLSVNDDVLCIGDLGRDGRMEAVRIDLRPRPLYVPH
jgi:hypothetical protein